MHDLIQVFGVAGGIWIVGSILLLWLAFAKTKTCFDRFKYPSDAIAFRAIALGNLFAPTLLGGWSWVIIVPANLAILTALIDALRGKSDSLFATVAPLSLMMFGLTSALFFTILFFFRWVNVSFISRKKTPVKKRMKARK